MPIKHNPHFLANINSNRQHMPIITAKDDQSSGQKMDSDDVSGRLCKPDFLYWGNQQSIQTNPG
ncbi:MAG: hypothetical protein GY869_24480 [Planctomycetes bacterium]|nr:hypothetical protein [Planctomycetota bacterium]